ncbi:dienelactone hydrolase family protein [Gillisia sp. M10.2A]|uniref:Dienelactone hydrolase family protein n=1 Tax=Gillisia lutea TaxID=2909668 RepID=A0ABS9EHB2_9FLAO|nr:dienelactone hydrolase family protein [Gillisia lutea]MCF4101130.1 dienelactone hydrolase family protein [Gillisia lutea]
MTAFKEKYQSISIDLKDVRLQGNLVIPENNLGIIIFSHGSGSSRNSPRNKYVGSILQQHGLATLLFDLLTEEEDQVYERRFDIDLLTKRLIEVTRWIQTDPRTKDLKIGYFGASTGAASALRAAGVLGDKLSAVVSRGGRPDLAMQELHKVKAPTLFLVGGWDDFVIDLNKLAYSKLECERELIIVPEASHLFEEPGKLEKVAHLSAKWFIKWFTT